MATNDSPTIYLAGPIAHADSGGSNWRDRIIETYPTTDFANPLDKYDASPGELDIVSGDSGDGEVSHTEIVEGDKELLAHSDAVLVGYTNVQSVGTPMEVHYAFRRGMPIVIWLRDETVLGDLSPWYHYHSDFVTSKAKHAVSYLWRNADAPQCRVCGTSLGAGYLCDECDTVEV